jgi:hypothetical protein
MTYAEFVEEVQAEYPEVQTGKMFGMPVLKLDGKALGGDWEGEAVFKLAPDDAVEALKIEGAYQFEPMPGHAMKQWIVVPVAQSEHWMRLAGLAVVARRAA